MHEFGASALDMPHFEEGVWLVGSLLHGLEQSKMAALFFANVLSHMRQQHQCQEALSLQHKHAHRYSALGYHAAHLTSLA